MIRSGEVHQRHRKVMNPAFTAAQLRSFMPLFSRYSAKVRSEVSPLYAVRLSDRMQQMCQLWKDEVLAGSVNGSVVAVNQWLARLTLDVIGDGEVPSATLPRCYRLKRNLF